MKTRSTVPSRSRSVLSRVTVPLDVTVCLVVQGDSVMDPTGTGSKIIPFWLSGFARSDDSRGTREALNMITHYLDASMVRHKGN